MLAGGLISAQRASGGNAPPAVGVDPRRERAGFPLRCEENVDRDQQVNRAAPAFNLDLNHPMMKIEADCFDENLFSLLSHVPPLSSTPKAFKLVTVSFGESTENAAGLAAS